MNKRFRQFIAQNPHMTAVELAERLGTNPQNIRMLANRAGLPYARAARRNDPLPEVAPVSPPRATFTSPPVYGRSSGTAGYVKLT